MSVTPGTRPMTKTATAPIPVTRCDHIALAVPSLDDAIAMLTSRYGVTVGKPKEVPEQGVRIAYADLGNIHLELMEPMDPASPVQGFLQKRPLGGLHHICLTTADADQAHADFSSSGGTPLGPPRPGHHGRKLFFLSPKDNCGALIEIESEDVV